ncbi:sensor domain-containing diguanylate cyclase, partial [Leptospira santarosai]
MQFKTHTNAQVENVKIKKRILFSLLAIIFVLMLFFLIYENLRMKKEIDRVVSMRTRVMKDYIRRVGSQTRALGLSISDYLTFFEGAPVNLSLIKKFKNHPDINRFGISHIGRDNKEGADAGTLTAVGSIYSMNPSL